MTKELAPAEHVAAACRLVTDVLAIVGNKWSVQVVAQLGRGTHRFGELQREIPEVSQKMLTSTLRGLERDGFVTRTFHPTIPPRVEYSLTDMGHDLLVPVKALGEWARLNSDRVAEARARFDASDDAPRAS
jgi:DNA-binding HxlR family transcriptional regulator